MALITVDTNVLARHFERASPLHPVATRVMKELRAQGHELVIAPQTLYELWVVLTRPATARGGFGRPPAEAARLLAACASLCRVMPDSSALLPWWLDLVKRYAVRGVRAHDAFGGRDEIARHRRNPHFQRERLRGFRARRRRSYRPE